MLAAECEEVVAQVEFDPRHPGGAQSWKQQSPTQKRVFVFFLFCFFPGAVNAKLRVPWPLAFAASKLLWETENKGASKCKLDSFRLIMGLFQGAALFRLQNNL